MLTFSLFSGMTLLLILEGTAIVTLLLGKESILRATTLSLPIGALTNVLIIFALTIVGIPLTPLSILLPTIIITITAGFFTWRMPNVTTLKNAQQEATTRKFSIVIALCSFILGSTLIYSFAHAVLLPTFQYDSATNWTMRSKISFLDRYIAFDPTEDRGMAKPQYPFLFHALQITVNQGQKEWGDTSANAILWLLSLSTFVALFLVIRSQRSLLHSLLTITGILSIPLFSLHLGQGYGDNVLAQYFLLSLVFLHLTYEEVDRKKKFTLLLLSGIFVSASVWTKSEGTFFGLIPWLLIVALTLGRTQETRMLAIRSAGVTLLLSIPWHLFALTKGLLLTPHGSDTTFAFHPEALSEVLHGLFDRGSFGIAWYVIIILGVTLIYEHWRKKNQRIDTTSFPGIVWGLLVFLEFLVVYLATPNVRFLLNAESFYRQMMIPAGMLIMSLGMAIRNHRIQADHEGLGTTTLKS